MNVLGIVAEYDPFHNGHLFHMVEAKKRVSPDLTLVVLSPCFKQRGELSLLSPTDRAFCALVSGADAVFSLPVLWTLRDAEHYALGAVSLLVRLGITHLAFGAETPDAGLLMRAAQTLESPSSVFVSQLKDSLSSGLGYPAAVDRALSAVLPGAESLLSLPNNILAVCYLRAILRLQSSVTPVIVPRSGAYHADVLNQLAPSASLIREHLFRGNYAEASAALPSVISSLIRQRFLEERIPDKRILDSLLLSRLRSMSDEEYRSLSGVSEGIENALRTAAKTVSSRSALIAALTGRRYPASRISRLCACALLSIAREDLDQAPLPEEALLLGIRNGKAPSGLWKNIQIPVISSFTEWKKAAHPADLAAWRIWGQCCRLADTLPFSEKIARV